MSIRLPGECIRDRDAPGAVSQRCEPLSQIESDDRTSFYCCGLNDGTTRTQSGDIYRLCFKNGVIDEMTDNDHLDLLDMASVIIQALSVKAHSIDNET